jgi:hypothetical protein
MRLRIATLGQVLFLPVLLCSFRPFYIITAFLFAATRSVVPVIVPVIVRHTLRSTAFSAKHRCLRQSAVAAVAAMDPAAALVPAAQITSQ